MRLPHTRYPWPVWSMLGAALALLTASLGGSGIEESRLVRMGRNAQRLEAADGIPHSHEQDEPDPAPSGLIVGRAHQPDAAGALRAALPDRTWSRRTGWRAATSRLLRPAVAPALVEAPPGSITPLTHQDVRPLSVRILRPTLGRAPPTT